MATKKQAEKTTGNRQAAYSARNRARLIKDAQLILAEIGPSATIEQIAAHAEVSPTTIYKYFENKDQLFIEALSEAWDDFVAWAQSNMTSEDLFEITLDIARSLLWAKKTHPLFADMLHNCVSQMPEFLVLGDKGKGEEAFSALAARGDVKQEDFDKRIVLWTNLWTGIIKSVFVTEELSPSEAEVALEIGLSIWGISNAKAKKLISRPLQFSPVE
jgi:AcrR family transcriptional regulator